MTSIKNRIGTSSDFRMPSNTHADPAPAEQQETSPKKPDESASSSRHIRSGKENLQRFAATHGKASRASVDDGTSEYDGSGAESSGVRRRAARAHGGDPTDRAADATDASQMRQGREPNLARKWGSRVLKGLVSALALSAGYRFVRNPGNSANSPAAEFTNAELANVLNSIDSVDAQILQKAQHAILEKFGSYIPANSDCYQVRAEVSPNVELGYGHYLPDKNELLISRYHRYQGGGLHTAVHEYCHCFSHPRFNQKLAPHSNGMEMVESLTEHISDKIPAYGRLSKIVSKMDSQYDGAEMSNGKDMLQAAKELEDAVGEATLMRAYFKGDKAAIRKLSRAAVNIYPKAVSRVTWSAALAVGGKDGARQLAECFVAASLLGEGKLPPNDIAFTFAQAPGWHLPVRSFSDINKAQQEALIEQGKKALERLGPKFDQAFYNFDEEVARLAIKAVREDLLANWKPVLTGKPFLDQ